MTLPTLLSALTKRGASEAILRAGSEIQICVDGQWRAQTANLTAAALDDMIAKAMPLDEEVAWRVPNGRASFSAQGYGIEANKQAGAVTIKLKQLAKASGGPLSAQSAGELKNSAFASSTTFAPSVDAPQMVPAPGPVVSTPPPMPNAIGEWHYCDLEGIQRGPISLIQVRSLVNMVTLNAQTLVWKEGMSDWLPLAQTELSRFLPQNQEENAPRLPTPRYGKPSNDSGTKGAVLPAELRGFNWGAFFLPVFWCFAHNLPLWGIGLFIMGWIPGINIGAGLVAAFIMGSNGNQMAWQNRTWSDVEEFKTVQAVWARWGLYVFLAFAIVLFIAMMNAFNS